MKRGAAHLEVEDDGPNEAERELRVAVHDVLGADVDQLDLLTCFLNNKQSVSLE